MPVTHTFTPGTLIKANEVNTNFSECFLKDGSEKMSGDILPDLNNTRDIGSSSLKFKDIYVTGNLIGLNTIFLGLLASDPSSPGEGQIWYNTTEKQFKGYNGDEVVILG